jgi:predicted amidohydrolase
MSKMLKIAGMQMEPVIMDGARNLERCLGLVAAAANEGARLIVFPEATMSGYVYRSLNEAVPVAEPVPGPAVASVAEACRELKVYVVFGLLEDGGRCKYYNTAVLVGPDGLIGKYRKLHLPYLGIDRFLNHGDRPPEVYHTEIGGIGLGICYDLDFPEHARALALLGADIIVNITNWPEGIEFIPEHLVPARARENHVYLVAVNRVGDERGVRFFGRSRLADPAGATLAEGRPYSEDILYSEIDPSLARQKRQVIVPGELEIDTIKDRRPECYGALVEPLVDRSRIRQ